MLVDHVIQALNAGRCMSAYPTLNPISFDGCSMLFSENYNRDRAWCVSYSTHGFWGGLIGLLSVQLEANGYVINLTKEQKKRLTAAYHPAIKKVQDDWKRRKRQAGI